MKELVLNHRTFGEVAVNEISFEKKRVDVVIKSTGELKPIALSALTNSFIFKNVPDELLSIIKTLQELEKYEAELKRQKALEKLNQITVHNYNEFGENVTKEHWIRMYELAETPRPYHESRAVILVDDSRIFVNASAALRYLESNPKTGNLLYDACDRSNKKYLGCTWRYATKNEIKEFCID